MFTLRKGVPAFVSDKRMPAAAAVWRQLMDALPDEMRVVRSPERIMLGMLAYYCVEWIEAVDDLAVHGHYERTETGAGGVKIVTNPSVQRRTIAHRAIVDLSARFGLTPLDLERLKASVSASADKTPASKPRGKKQAKPSPEETPTKDDWSGLIGPVPPSTTNRRQ